MSAFVRRVGTMEQRDWTDCPATLQSKEQTAPAKGYPMGASKPQPAISSPELSSEKLDSWKEIAAYLKRDERTVRRWEKEGLPVHRKVHKKQASVFAYRGEIDTWWNDGRQRLEPGKSSSPALAIARDGGPLLRSRRLWIPVIGFFVILAGAFSFNVAGIRVRIFAPQMPPIRSIAVLPLENLSGDANQEYFVDGMTDALITQLAKVHGLRVISRTSVMQFKNTKKTIPEIARELNVEGVIEGSIFRSVDRVRITAQLINGRSDQHVWSESYERDVKDVLTLQHELARTIAVQVRAVVTPAEEERLRSRQSVNPETYEAYLRGRSYLEKWTPDGAGEGLHYFQRAI